MSYELLIHKGSPFELRDAVIKGVPCKVFPHGPQTLRDVFMKSAAFAAREFIIKGDTRLTFGQAFQRASCFTRILRQKYSIKKGSRVALIMETGPEWAVVFMALCFAGAVAVLIPVDAKGSAAADAAELTNCELAIVDLSSAGKINYRGAKRFPIINVMRQADVISRIDCGSPPDFSIYNPADTSGGNAYIDEAYEALPDDEALISFTSGTTGTPKGAVFSHRNMTTGLMNMMLGGLRMSCSGANDKRKHYQNAQPCSLLLSPFPHIGGYSQLMLMCYLGGKIILMPEWDVKTATALIETEKVRSLCGLSPATAGDLLRANRSTDGLRSLTHLNIHGAALRKKFIRDLMGEFPHVNLGTGYGMTETCGAISVASGMELLDNSEFSGLVLPSADIKITDQDGREAALGNYGEIWVRGAMVMQGYCFGRDASGVTLEAGRLKTGDRGYIDHAGNLYVAGRFDTLQCGKKRTSSGELERLVCELDAVDEAAAVEISGSGQDAARIVLTILPNSGILADQEELEREVTAFVKTYADDILVVIMNNIPRTASGKVDRGALKTQITGFMNCRISER